MAEIKIFVSHRIDVNSEQIENPFYVPIRCGAVFDQKNPMNIAGDDTGDNISERRMSFCEFTVQYWAWKNVRADYYGLCHYRRYLSFADTRYPKEDHGMVEEQWLNQASIHKYGLDQARQMEEMISRCDVITSEPADVRQLVTPKGFQRTVRELWEANVGLLLEENSIPKLLELISRLTPEYKEAAEGYLSGVEHRGYNCYILRKDLFDRLCRFQFPILFEMEKYQQECGILSRVPGYIGEILYGIFMYQITKLEKWRIKELQLVLFRDTVPVRNALDLAWRRIKRGANRAVRAAVDPIMPKGSWRREAVKRAYYAVTQPKRRAAASIK